jgi:hypothetical protein
MRRSDLVASGRTFGLELGHADGAPLQVVQHAVTR